jgi:hypothetical protein
MTLIESLGLVVAILAISVAVAYYFQKGTPTIGDFTEDLDQDLEEKPKKKTSKPKPQQEDIVFPPDAVLHLEGEKEEVVFEPAKPKKKRKYYPKKKPTN